MLSQMKPLKEKSNQPIIIILITQGLIQQMDLIQILI